MKKIPSKIVISVIGLVCIKSANDILTNNETSFFSHEFPGLVLALLGVGLIIYAWTLHGKVRVA